MLSRSSLLKSRLARALLLAIGVGLLAAQMAPDRSALAKDPPKKDAPKKDTPKKDAKKEEPRKFSLAPGTDQRDAETIGLINKKLEAAWKENKLTPSKQCDDHEFIRRASLDIIGRIATMKEIERYFKDPAATRRSMLIERLLKDPDYPNNWSNIWTNWLLTRSGVFGRGKYRDQMQNWLDDQFARGDTKETKGFRYDKMVRDLLTASGKNDDNGAVNFILAHVGEPNPPPKRGELGQFQMVPLTSRITRLFLGVQTQCTQCHDHPFDNNLTQQHFWGVNAYLHQVKREGNPPMRRRDTAGPLTLVDDPNVNVEGMVYYEKVKNALVKQTKAVFLDGTRMPLTDATGPDGKTKLPISGLARRQELAQRVTEHPNFPKGIVNRMWAHFFGRGFTQPMDDLNEENQVSIPELFDELSAAYKHYDYDQRRLIRWICNSSAYQLSCVANKTNEKSEAEPFFSRMQLKMVSPEQLFESLMVATKALDAETKEAKKTSRDRWLNSLIANFGDDEGNEVVFNGTILQALMMMNGKDINDAITRKEKGTLADIVRDRKGQSRLIINDLFLATLNRPPSQTDINKILAAARRLRGRDKDAIAPYQDLFWALLNSSEFMLNH
jgi:hypothetical protein